MRMLLDVFLYIGNFSEIRIELVRNCLDVWLLDHFLYGLYECVRYFAGICVSCSFLKLRRTNKLIGVCVVLAFRIPIS